jgi:hypothetical protein
MAAGAILANDRLHARVIGVSPGKAVSNSSPGNCRTQSFFG